MIWPLFLVALLFFIISVNGLVILRLICRPLCSILLLLGLFTRFATITLIICMLVIAFVIHWSDPLGDKEHALLYGFGYLTVFLAGPGKWALDDRLK